MTPAPRPSRTARRAAAALSVAALSLGLATVPAGTATAASASAPMIFGAAGPSRTVIEDHEQLLGGRLNGLRVYKQWDDKLFTATNLWARDTGHTLFMSINADREDGSGPAWARIAAAQPGSALYADMVRQAGEVKEFGDRVYLAFHHEPEAASSWKYGDGDDYVRAYRNWVSVFRKVGVPNVSFTWTMTAYGFARDDARRAELYYPGDAYVDYIAADGYNWYRCREDDGKWRDLADVIEAHRQFGLKHPDKGLMLWEFGSAEDKQQPGRKADWFRDATALFQLPAYRQYRAVLTWEGRAHRGTGPSCGFDYTSSASATRAWRDMADDPAFRATSLR